MSDLFWRLVEVLNVMLLGMLIWQVAQQRIEDREWRRTQQRKAGDA